jgi:hypothetical protein
MLYVKLHFKYVPLGDSCFVFFLVHHGFQVPPQVKIEWAMIWGPRRPTIAARRYHNEVVHHLPENTPKIRHPCLTGTA